MSFRLEFRSKARRRLAKLARCSPQIAKDIHAKVTWLAENAEGIRHDRLKGHREYSLHCGQYRILYSLDRASRMVCIEDIDKHDEAYRRLQRR